MKWIQFINGPLAGQMSEVAEPQDNYFAIQEPDPFTSFKQSASFVPPTDLLSERVVYHRIPDTTQPIKYMTQHFDRAQEIINFVRHLGFTLDEGQEQMMRYWFSDVSTSGHITPESVKELTDDAKVGDTQHDSVRP